ncbi:hypothetical protein GGF43_001860, partial [Coemansia sp. RSA 2618]
MASAQSNADVYPAHMLQALWEQGDGYLKHIVDRLGVQLVEFDRAIKQAIGKLHTEEDSTQPENDSDRYMYALYNQAKEEMQTMGDSLVAVDTLLAAMSYEESVGEIMRSADVVPKQFREAIKKARGSRKVDSKSAEANFDTLSEYAVDMIKQVESGEIDPVIGREDEIRQMIRVLCRRNKSNPILAGPPGTGKTAIVEGLAQRIVANDVPQTLKTHLFSLDM